MAPEPCVAFRIDRFVVLTAIDFNDQMSFNAGKIDDIRTHRVLLAESEAAELTTP